MREIDAYDPIIPIIPNVAYTGNITFGIALAN
jgi:hypothetical protein